MTSFLFSKASGTDRFYSFPGSKRAKTFTDARYGRHCPIWNVWAVRATTTSKVASEDPAFPRHLQSVAWNDLERGSSLIYLRTHSGFRNPRSINDCKFHMYANHLFVWSWIDSDLSILNLTCSRCWETSIVSRTPKHLKNWGVWSLVTSTELTFLSSTPYASSTAPGAKVKIPCLQKLVPANGCWT